MTLTLHPCAQTQFLTAFYCIYCHLTWRCSLLILINMGLGLIQRYVFPLLTFLFFCSPFFSASGKSIFC
ncbi:hypothetical protein BCR41DRAFT_344843 [Lobosporangium transversale]|uniref:Uncharacterized protein n=1 Tax=Lobosporangium transversale TaxID=64571 RepID=A0A1Y2H0X8_9FUNG|nr:hypothetical protein BCR41DRAFT_344843 [Lobosporangium transversale]ORZ28209.1 hypothetical protein BCR41DRAFT_344843 [Lobosporangium transversale]|eukprot:XP_021885894.1 hypothetical protein BCR41DRAFT_344843 [Lobosporangium transversale]